MSNLIIAILAYIIDKIFGEFTSKKHPVVYIGDMILFFEKQFYKDSILRGSFLVLFVLSLVTLFSLSITLYLDFFAHFIEVIISAVIASMFIAHKMLRDSVIAIVTADDKHKEIAMLVSRDTEGMSESDIYKSAIETYAENLSDGVIAPIFYLLLFGLPGIVIYKAINTMDSMVGYRNEKYEKYGKVAAKLDDIANYIPSRITAVLIMLFARKRQIWSFYKDGAKHDSPNAGHPITAMALAIDIKLGGDTSYFGKVKKKAHFGEGREEINARDVVKALEVL